MSDLFAIYTNLDPEILISQLKAEAESQYPKWAKQKKEKELRRMTMGKKRRIK